MVALTVDVFRAARRIRRSDILKTIHYTIQDKLGIHARPAGLLVKECRKYNSAIKLTIGEKTADMRKLFELMSLAAKYGDQLTVTVEGSDEEIAAMEIEQFILSHL